MYNINEYKNIIKERLSDYRFYHSLCVADEEKAEVAGILHDICKEADLDEQLKIIEKAGMTITEFERNSKKFYHQISGAAYAKVILGIEDEEILNAIRFHTTGRANMSLMDEIVYLADFISADRDYDDIDNIRAEAERGKEYGLMYATRYTIKSVVKKGNPLHSDTVNAYNWLLSAYFGGKYKVNKG